MKAGRIRINLKLFGTFNRWRMGHLSALPYQRFRFGNKIVVIIILIISSNSTGETQILVLQWQGQNSQPVVGILDKT